ncbi:hypothetical protein [Spirosoma panaciterrae]|uniref:hypothetical protein n=1 Tax=Spirosoma panaciterrae TaxID=496058 RepID=UPI0012F9BC68|nr:hypothetical protein [Spirosoma panaciterrae]
MNPLLPKSTCSVTASARTRFFLYASNERGSASGWWDREWILDNGHSFRKGKMVREGLGA